MTIPRVNLLGVGISAINMELALKMFEDWVGQRSRTYVCVTPAHAIMDCYHQPELRTIFNRSGMTTPDGMSVVWLLKWRGQRRVERVYGPDLMRSVCNQSVQKGWRHYLYGGGPGVPEMLKTTLETQYPGLQIVGTYSPPFRPLTEKEDHEVVEQINAANPDIVWLGLSTPRQERWMSDHRERLNAPVLVGVGAAFDFISGRKPQAPRWMQRSGLEWLFRLATEPVRLWPRYRQYPLFVGLVLAQMLGLLEFPMDVPEGASHA